MRALGTHHVYPDSCGADIALHYSHFSEKRLKTAFSDGGREAGPEAACSASPWTSDNSLEVQNEEFFVAQSNKLDNKGP